MKTFPEYFQKIETALTLREPSENVLCECYVLAGLLFASPTVHSHMLYQGTPGRTQRGQEGNQEGAR